MNIIRPITAQPKDWEPVGYPRPDYPVNVFVIDPSDPNNVFMTSHPSCDDAYRQHNLMRDNSERATRQALRKWNFGKGGPGFFSVLKGGYIYLIQAQK
jgi:hypothetical protein